MGSGRPDSGNAALSWQGMPRPEGDPAGWRDWAYAVIAANPVRATKLGRLAADCRHATAGTDLTDMQVAQCLAVTMAAMGHYETDDMITWGVTDLGSATRLGEHYDGFCAGEQAAQQRLAAPLRALAAVAEEMLDHILSASNVVPGEDTMATWRRYLTEARSTLSEITDDETTDTTT